jgi:hypothetical protein
VISTTSSPNIVRKDAECSETHSWELHLASVCCWVNLRYWGNYESCDFHSSPHQVHYWMGCRSLETNREHRSLTSPPASAELSALFAPPLSTQRSLGGWVISCPLGYKLWGLQNKWEPAQPANHKVFCSQQQLPLHKEEASTRKQSKNQTTNLPTKVSS